MANYDNRLGDWFKQLDQVEQQLKAKKKGVDEQSNDQPVAERSWQSAATEVESVIPRSPAKESPDAAVAVMTETRAVVADVSRTDDSGAESVAKARAADNAVEDVAVVEEVGRVESDRGLFDDADISPVEDFFSFLSHNGEDSAPDEKLPPVVESFGERGLGNLSEGTGEPRPISYIPRPVVEPAPEPVVEATVEQDAAPAPAEAARGIASELPSEAVFEHETVTHHADTHSEVEDSELRQSWNRMPLHLQTLFGRSAGEEIAQNSYKTFKETREELVQRLLDPVISLEEAARVLNVCPTTVRRYTNRGVLKHLRTAGNQRRFRLSDVLAFAEAGVRGVGVVEAVGESEA